MEYFVNIANVCRVANVCNVSYPFPFLPFPHPINKILATCLAVNSFIVSSLVQLTIAVTSTIIYRISNKLLLTSV